MSSQEAPGTVILGLPDDFEMSPVDATDLKVDILLGGVSLKHGLFETANRLFEARKNAEERSDSKHANALQLLGIVCQFAYSDNNRAPFGRHMAGTFDNGGTWYTPLPEDLSDAHMAALEVLLPSIETLALRAKIADVLWHRSTPRNVDHAREAVKAYSTIAERVFDLNTWVDSEQQLARAFRIAAQLGSGSPEFKSVRDLAQKFLTKLDGKDRLYYTERLIRRMLPYIEAPEAEILLQRSIRISEDALSSRDFDRSRAYYDLGIQLALRADRGDAYVKQLRITRAETYVTEAACQGTEMARSFFLRSGRQALLDAGAPRERLAEVSQQLDESQRLSPSEMSVVSTRQNAGVTPDIVRGVVNVPDPIEAMWRLAALPIMQRASRARTLAEETLSKNVFAFGFGRRHISADGRQQGTSPGSLGSTDREGAIRGAMRFNASHYRIGAVFSAIEPGRRQLLLQHEYTLPEIFDALRDRPLIPYGHLLRFAKGIHAGLVGEFDIAIHILAPQLEHAMREILRHNGAIIYSTNSDGVQSLLSLENVLDHDVSRRVLGDDFRFAIETTFSERLGANLRNEIAHGIINDVTSNSVDAIFGWWLILRLLGAYGPNPLPGSITSAIPDDPDDPL